MNHSLFNCLMCSGSVSFFCKKNIYSTYKCQKCGFVFVHPRPSQQELAHFYSHLYFESHLRPARLRSDADAAHQRLAHINSLLPEAKKSGLSILDVGSGNSTFSSQARSHGFVPSIVEVNDTMRRNAPDTFACWPQLDQVDQSFDVITAWEYIEHVVDPLSDLCLMYNALKPGGVLAISSPNKRMSGPCEFLNWEQFKPPEHINFFNHFNLESSLSQIGFIPVSYRFIGLHLVCSAWRSLGRSSDRRTCFWPLSYLLWISLRPLWFSPFLKSMLPYAGFYEGIEIYCVKPR